MHENNKDSKDEKKQNKNDELEIKEPNPDKQEQYRNYHRKVNPS